MINCSLTARRGQGAEKCPQNDSIKILFGLSPNRIFFENYCFRDLHFQILELTALCEFDKANREKVGCS